jgi:hypothetical protein
MYGVSEWSSNCCLTPSELFVSCIVAWVMCFMMTVLYNTNTLSCILFIMLAHREKSTHVDMSFHGHDWRRIYKWWKIVVESTFRHLGESNCTPNYHTIALGSESSSLYSYSATNTNFYSLSLDPIGIESATFHLGARWLLHHWYLKWVNCCSLNGVSKVCFHPKVI